MFRFVCTLLLATSLTAHAAPRANGENGVKGPQKHLSTIVLAGVAGATLGLSTLSFYGRPQDKLNNIAIGAAVGIIVGAVYSTFKAATEPRDFYGLREKDGELLAMTPVESRPVPAAPSLGLTLEF